MCVGIFDAANYEQVNEWLKLTKMLINSPLKWKSMNSNTIWFKFEARVFHLSYVLHRNQNMSNISSQKCLMMGYEMDENAFLEFQSKLQTWIDDYESSKLPKTFQPTVSIRVILKVWRIHLAASLNHETNFIFSQFLNLGKKIFIKRAIDFNFLIVFEQYHKNYTRITENKRRKHYVRWEKLFFQSDVFLDFGA